MKTLVFGGAGFIGSQFVRTEESAGHEVCVYDALTYAGHPENLAGTRAQLVVGDIQNRTLVASTLEVFRPDRVINFAAESHVDRSIESPGAFIDTNLRGTFVLLECALRYFQGLSGEAREGFRFLQVSTDEVFGALGDTGAFSESSPYAPNSPYSASKAGGDHLVRAWHHTFGLPTVTTHCSNNYGPRQFPEKLIPHMIQSALRGAALPVYGDGRHVRDWIHVEDHAGGLQRALDHGTPGASYCFGGAAERTNLEVVYVLCDLLDRLRPKGRGSYRDQISFVKDRLGHDRRYAIDDAFARRELGFGRKHTFETGLESTVRWYLDHQAWCESVLEYAKRPAANRTVERTPS